MTPQTQWLRVFEQEDLNFLLTNRIPRRLTTLFLGWFSKIEQPLVRDLSIGLWRTFSGLDLTEAKKKLAESAEDVKAARRRMSEAHSRSVSELEADRQLHRKIAELSDVVTELLIPLQDRDEARAGTADDVGEHEAPPDRDTRQPGRLPVPAALRAGGRAAAGGVTAPSRSASACRARPPARPARGCAR